MASLKDPGRFAEAMAEKEKKMTIPKKGSRLPKLCFTKKRDKAGRIACFCRSDRNIALEFSI